MNFGIFGRSGWIIFCSLYIVSSQLATEEKNLQVMITSGLSSIKAIHNGKPVTVQRNQNRDNRIKEEFALTSRQCPPHCIQPIKLKGIETVGELDVLEYLKRIADGDQSVLVVDTRSEDHVKKGTIPGSINVFGDRLIAERGANPITVDEILTGRFGAVGGDGSWKFKDAKTLVLYCYGIWCGQAPRTFKALVELGYPKSKLKWYRGGMQAWESVGLTTVRD